MPRSWNHLRLPIASVTLVFFGQFIALGVGLGACSGSDPFTNLDPDGGDGTDDGSIDSGKHDAAKDSGHHDSAVPGEGGNTDGGVDDGSVIIDPGFDASVYCGQVVCNGQICCGSGIADGGVPATYTCQNQASVCAGVRETCDQMGDCSGGKLCCASVAGGHVTAIGCATSCGTGFRICDPNTPTDCSSTGGGTCTEMPQLPNSSQFYCL